MASLSAFSSGAVFFLTEDHEVFGEIIQYETLTRSEKLLDLAKRYHVGYDELILANPGIDSRYPGPGKQLIIPTSWILPEIPLDLQTADTGYILINLAEYRLYLTKREGPFLSVIPFPIGIGRKGFETPAGRYTIAQKLKDPAWIIPPSFREEFPDLPDVVPPGPDNPIGKYALSLSSPGFLIHETKSMLGVGRKVSHGCIRMLPEDMEMLFSLVYEGYPVIIVNQPVKIGMKDRTPYIEVHRDYLSSRDLLLLAVDMLKERNLIKTIDPDTLHQAIAEKRGFPVPLISAKRE